MAHYGYPLRIARFSSHWVLTKGLFLCPRRQIRFCNIMASDMITCVTPSGLPDRILMNKVNLLCGFSEIRFRTQVSIMPMPDGLRSARSTSLTHLLLLLLRLIMLVKLHLLLIKVQCDEGRGIISCWVSSSIVAVSTCTPLIHVCRSQI